MAIKFNCERSGKTIMAQHLVPKDTLNCPFCKGELTVSDRTEYTDESSDILTAVKAGRYNSYKNVQIEMSGSSAT